MRFLGDSLLLWTPHQQEDQGGEGNLKPPVDGQHKLMLLEQYFNFFSQESGVRQGREKEG